MPAPRPPSVASIATSAGKRKVPILLIRSSFGIELKSSVEIPLGLIIRHQGPAHGEDRLKNGHPREPFS